MFLSCLLVCACMYRQKTAVKVLGIVLSLLCCFDTVGWASGQASGL